MRAGYEARVAGDGARALALHAEQPGDLLVLEVLGALIDDLFELARIEAGALTWSMRQF